MGKAAAANGMVEQHGDLIRAARTRGFTFQCVAFDGWNGSPFLRLQGRDCACGIRWVDAPTAIIRDAVRAGFTRQ